MGRQQQLFPSSPTAKHDAKLFHLVQKMVQATTSTDVDLPNIDYIVTILRTQHREYLRKDLQQLHTQVQAVLEQVIATTSQQHQQQQVQAPTQRSRKRKTPEKTSKRNQQQPSSVDDEDEDDIHNALSHAEDVLYDQEAATHDAQREALHASGTSGGLLNASLRDRYKKLARSSQKIDKAKQQDDEEEEDAIAKNNDNDNDNKDTTSRRGTEKSLSKNGKRKGRRLVQRESSSALFSLPGNNTAVSFVVPNRPTERYSDLGGMEEVIQQVRQLIEYPLTRPELYRHLGVEPPRGVLLRGVPGTGKTHLANAVAGQLGVPYFRVSAPELVSGMSGESEARIRDLFQAASDAAPALIFLDELDAIAPKRSDASGSRGMEKRMVAQLLTSMDMLHPKNNRNQAAVLVLAATNRPDSLDSALRRAGRFDKEILLGVPDEEARERIIRAMTKDVRLSGDFDYKQLARKTPGFVGADIHSLAKEAAVLAINRIFHDVLREDVRSKESQSEVDGSIVTDSSNLSPLTSDQMEPLYVTMEDFLNAVPLVQPSSKREGFATVPDVSWDDIGALQSIRAELTISVLEPIRNPEKFKALGLSLPAGVLLYGPPGCGKTLLAKAIAHESGANFISVKGPELLDKYVGESERAVRLVFERARSSSPCVVFFDELDSLVPKRRSDSGGGGVSERVVNQLLTELDGLESRRSVFVIAATNRPELIDPAMLRPGRLDKLLYVPLPTAEDRVSILKALSNGIVLDDSVDLVSIGRSPRASGYSGADCAALLREAGLAVLKEDAAAHASGTNDVTKGLSITSRHFDAAFRSVMPSVSKKDQARYDRIRERIAGARSRVETAPEEDDTGVGFGDGDNHSLKK